MLHAIRRVDPALGLAGRPRIPADKSIAHRAAILAAIGEGTSEIVGFPEAADPLATVQCLQALGVEMRFQEGSLFVEGRGRLGLEPPSQPLDCRNSGTTMRLLMGLLAGQSFETELIGDDSLSRRPMDRVAEPLRRMGAKIDLNGITAPVRIKPADLVGIEYELPVASAQVKSAILLAGLYASGDTTVVEVTTSRDHTERMLGLDVLQIGDQTRVMIASGHPVPLGSWIVPRDMSAAFNFLVAGAIVPHCAIEMTGVGLNPTRAAAIQVLRAMGADIRIRNERSHHHEPLGDVGIRNDGGQLAGLTIDGDLIPLVIDELPLLAVAAACASGTTTIRNAAELRVKETDRITATVAILRAMGADVEELEDGMIIRGGNTLRAAEVDSRGDHRIAMAAGVAALAAHGTTTIHGADAVAVSFPDFWSELASLAGEDV